MADSRASMIPNGTVDFIAIIFGFSTIYTIDNDTTVKILVKFILIILVVAIILRNWFLNHQKVNRILSTIIVLGLLSMIVLGGIDLLPSIIPTATSQTLRVETHLPSPICYKISHEFSYITNTSINNDNAGIIFFLWYKSDQIPSRIIVRQPQNILDLYPKGFNIDSSDIKGKDSLYLIRVFPIKGTFSPPIVNHFSIDIYFDYNPRVLRYRIESSNSPEYEEEFEIPLPKRVDYLFDRQSLCQE